MMLDSKVPTGPIADKWTKHKNTINVVGPANKRNIDIIVVGTGLAGGSASASLAEMGYNVKAFCYQDSPRRAHSIAAQGGINAAKNYQNDGDSIYRLFYDTVKGGDYRAREANVYRLAEVSVNIIDQCVAQGVPFARDYGGLLDNRSFGGVLVSRTFYARGQTGQQLLLGAYSAMNRQIAKGKIKMYNRHEMVELVKVDGIEWIRLHYAFPNGFPVDVLEVINSEPKICNYIDIPLQHISNKILKSMKRGASMEKINDLLQIFRDKVPEIAIRTTLIVGYPGETNEDFERIYSSKSGIYSDPYQILGVSQNAPTEEIKQKWKQLAINHHPDRLISQGIPEDLIQKSTSRLKEINNAWDIIQKQR